MSAAAAAAAAAAAFTLSCGDAGESALNTGNTGGLAAGGASAEGNAPSGGGRGNLGGGAAVTSGGEGNAASLGLSGGSGVAGNGASSGGAAGARDDAGAPNADAGSGRGGLFFDPPEAVYSVSLSVNTTGVSQPIVLHNETPSAVSIAELSILPSAAFVLNDPPATPLRIAAGAELRLDIRFLPDAAAAATSVYAAVLSAAAEGGEPSAQVELYGLAMNTANSEASLAQVVQALGYDIDVGGTSTTLGTGSAAIGEEIVANRFVKAAGGAVGLQPVARYSPFEAAPYGYYTGTNPGVTRNPLGTLSEGPADNVANRTLFPPLDPGSMTAFDPGAESFGIYAESAANVPSLGADGRFYQEDALNSDQSGVLPIHRFRVYPLRNRAGQAVADSFLLATEEASNSDYQDYVFILSNVALAD